MTNQQKVNALFTAIATVASMNPSNEGEFELVREAQEFFINPLFTSLQKEGFDKNFFAVNKMGIPFSTKNGFNRLFAEPKVIIKTITKPVDKQTDAEIISSFVESGFAICHRLPNAPVLQKKFKENYSEIADAITCVTNTSNEVLFPETVEVKS